MHKTRRITVLIMHVDVGMKARYVYMYMIPVHLSLQSSLQDEWEVPHNQLIRSHYWLLCSNVGIILECLTRDMRKRAGTQRRMMWSVKCVAVGRYIGIGLGHIPGRWQPSTSICGSSRDREDWFAEVVLITSSLRKREATCCNIIRLKETRDKPTRQH